ncbi:MAG TPA: hypothetical protein VFV37_11030 [Luteibaculaceae bacterium]|nr:hypothetical protein [Luteibaculaceae bacterium]
MSDNKFAKNFFVEFIQEQLNDHPLPEVFKGMVSMDIDKMTLKTNLKVNGKAYECETVMSVKEVKP